METNKIKEIVNQLNEIINNENSKPIEKIKCSNRTQLIEKFEELLPYMANLEVEVIFYKKPDFKKLYNENLLRFDNYKDFERAMSYGEKRTIKGKFIIDKYGFKRRHDYLLINDIEDNNIEKSINIKNLISFKFNNILYYINE